MYASCWRGEFKANTDYNGYTLLYMYALFKEGNKDTMNRVVMLDFFLLILDLFRSGIRGHEPPNCNNMSLKYLYVYSSRT